VAPAGHGQDRRRGRLAAAAELTRSHAYAIPTHSERQARIQPGRHRKGFNINHFRDMNNAVQPTVAVGIELAGPRWPRAVSPAGTV
jgi:hypothetical protein